MDSWELSLGGWKITSEWLGARPRQFGLGLDGWKTSPEWLGARHGQLENKIRMVGGKAWTVRS